MYIDLNENKVEIFHNDEIFLKIGINDQIEIETIDTDKYTMSHNFDKFNFKPKVKNISNCIINIILHEHEHEYKSKDIKNTEKFVNYFSKLNRNYDKNEYKNELVISSLKENKQEKYLLDGFDLAPNFLDEHKDNLRDDFCYERPIFFRIKAKKLYLTDE